MSKHRVYHIIPHHDGGWAVTETDAPLPIIAFHSKDAAVAFAESLADGSRPSTLVVHKRDKTVEREAEYREN